MPISQTIVRYAIHPAIGIARVGNAREEFYFAPQAPGDLPAPPYKDRTGAVKRQAARFRIYGYDERGDVVQEITADDAEISWRVHLANRKAGWYQFLNAMDLGPLALAAPRRNGAVGGDDRRQLVIDPGPRAIGGRNQVGPTFDTGEFMTVPVYLGELRTDERGRLIVLGGRGRSASGGNTCSPATTFANNDGWHDDVADGPVRATVRIDGRAVEAEPAMVVVAPPNFGQGLYAAVTMYDVVLDLFVRELNWLAPPARPSFWRDIYPIFQRLVQCQWVNQGVYFLFGQNSPGDLTAPARLEQLADPSPRSRAERERLFHWFLDPDARRAEPIKLPPFYGDAYGDFSGVAHDGLALTRTQHRLLAAW
ncbi:MAG: LodA/GoxA family CTQ-dependent oxidase, partial [Chloroflexota bacterium]|nr:LodA/GoxA family CTQ-dependent oxidase [Chloroflexota bacterium]